MKPIDQLEFTDDFMFGAVMKNPEICRQVLERLLKIPISRIEYPQLQKTISPYYQSRGIRLDVYCSGEDKVYDIEMQNSTFENLARRTRYYQSMMDIDQLSKGTDFSQLKDSFIIFICRKDPFNMNEPVYLVKSTFKNLRTEDGREIELEDGVSRYFFNAPAYEKETDGKLRNLLQYIGTAVPNDGLTRKIKTEVEDNKSKEIFRTEYMAWGLAERDAEKRGYALGEKQGYALGEKQGEQNKALTDAKIMIRDFGIPKDQVIEKLHLTETQIQQLNEEGY